MIILDTNVVSEVLRPAPAAEVMAWMAEQSGPHFYLTTITEAELRHGVALLPAGRRRKSLSQLIDEILDHDFHDRVLPFDRAAAHAYAMIAAERRAAGKPIAQLDCQIAAIARAGGFSVATRNIQDFANCGISLIDPWRG